MEDAGFDWKILGPDVQEEDYVAHTCDQDAYAYRYDTTGVQIHFSLRVTFLFWSVQSCGINPVPAGDLVCKIVPARDEYSTAVLYDVRLAGYRSRGYSFFVGEIWTQYVFSSSMPPACER